MATTGRPPQVRIVDRIQLVSQVSPATPRHTDYNSRSCGRHRRGQTDRSTPMKTSLTPANHRPKLRSTQTKKRNGLTSVPPHSRVTLMAAYPTAAKRDERHPTCRACDPNPRYDERTDRQHLRQFVSRIA